MGIRLHKHMGFGLDNLVLDNQGKIDDPRINTSAFDQLPSLTLIEYKQWLLEKSASQTVGVEEPNFHPSVTNSDLVYLRHERVDEGLKQKSASNYIHSWPTVDNKVSGDKGILLMQPYITVKEWSRFDDAIDYAEYAEQVEAGNISIAPEVTKLTYAPYPYDGFYVDRRTGEPVDRQIWNVIRRLADSVKQDSDDNEHQKGSEMVQRMVKNTLGFSSLDEAKKSIKPQTPSEVVDFATWANIFTDTTTAHTLTPMIVRSWS